MSCDAEMRVRMEGAGLMASAMLGGVSLEMKEELFMDEYVRRAMAELSEKSESLNDSINAIVLMSAGAKSWPQGSGKPFMEEFLESKINHLLETFDPLGKPLFKPVFR